MCFKKKKKNSNSTEQAAASPRQKSPRKSARIQQLRAQGYTILDPNTSSSDDDEDKKGSGHSSDDDEKYDVKMQTDATDHNGERFFFFLEPHTYD